MKIAFTICSNNYLSLARALGKTLAATGNDYHFIIGLVDKMDDQLKDWYEGFTILPCDQIGIPDLEEIALKYSIAEFNTALKPFYFQHLFKQYPDAEYITFLDPDMLIYRRLEELEQGHQQYEILLTPHILHPMQLDGKNPTEISYLSTGTFNLGFLSLRQGPNTTAFLDWWSERLRHFCYFDFPSGLFVDQKWVNLVPVFFESVFVLKHPGYNVAYWNLQERTLSEYNGQYFINEQFPLSIYHFSSVGIKQGLLFHKQQDRYTDADLPLNKELFMAYRQIVLDEGYLQTNPYRCYYVEKHNAHVLQQQRSSFSGRVKLWLKSVIPEKRRAKLKKKLLDFANS
ncbi:glycosyl transferase [Pseudoflavitalea sp. G-6-1-2]|uniref:glycosyl transferase n=1 Tax=Pseudoflavitalea sp. G-6-1-2 TaxID=2728841 RepID=UPI00146D7EE3|nr:glycosyl transferase [Pseudoflavitalea sp. G-6-1-2]NML23767.1 glycosyl transferase [Pseudoflavitalea sp. G-6-1-2]